jgi:hypothetical protein
VYDENSIGGKAGIAGSVVELEASQEELGTWDKEEVDLFNRGYRTRYGLD